MVLFCKYQQLKNQKLQQYVLQDFFRGVGSGLGVMYFENFCSGMKQGCYEKNTGAWKGGHMRFLVHPKAVELAKNGTNII